MATNSSGKHSESYPIRKTWDGWDKEYSSVEEFKRHLTADLLSSEKCDKAWVFETEYSSGHESNSVESSKVFRRSIAEKMTHVLRKIANDWWGLVGQNILAQFWAEKKIEGRCCLATLHQPFAVNSLAKGVSWVRNICRQHYYYIADEDQLGPPGRVFRNGNPESSPDILLYSTKEFPLRDLVTCCGLKSYLALPIFDVHHNQCVGVLEFIYEGSLAFLTPRFDDALKEVGLRSTHNFRNPFENMITLQSQSEISGMLDLAMKSIPQLHLAQVWLPCNQCANNSRCMKRKIFKMGSLPYFYSYGHVSKFVDACGFHNIRNGQRIVGLALSSTKKSYFCKNLSEFSISEYPMKHYAQRARLSSCFAICPRNKHSGNDVCVFEFFLQPQSRDDASIQSILYLLLKIMEKELKSFEIVTERFLGIEYQPLEEHILATPMKECQETLSVLEFKKFLPPQNMEKVNSSGLYNFCEKGYGWIFWSMKGEELSEINSNGSDDIIKLSLSELLSIQTSDNPFLIQFWEPKIIGKRSVLSTSEHPFALNSLQKGLCWYRKQSIQYHYYIGEGAKEEELGSPGRVFLNGRPESSNDPRLYSRREFPLGEHLVRSGASTYLALPLFGLLDKQCVGVLEFVGLIPYDWNQIYEKLQKYKLTSIHINPLSSPPIAHGQNQALSEIMEMLKLVLQSPQLQTASVWIPSSQLDHKNTEISCMERARFSSIYNYEFHNDWRINAFIEACKFHQPQITNGVIGKVIESESKLYFCEDLCSSSICEQPLAHYVQVARLEICFAICLKSSYTESSLHVIEFFLTSHSTKYEYSRTLCFLLSMMKQILKSFKVASGRQLGEELIYEVHFESDGIDSRTYAEDASQNMTGFDTTNQLIMEKFGGQCNLPLGFENVQYGHETEQQYPENQIHFSNIDHEQERNIVDAINVEDEAQNISGVNFEEGSERDRSSTSFHVSYEQLKSQFGKSRKEAAKNLGVSISTFKRKCRDYSIHRWPSKKNNVNNPSLFQKKFAIKGVENADYKKSARSGFDLKTSDYPIEPNLSSHPIEKTTELANKCQITDVMIKAKFKGDFLKFKFCVSRGVEKLNEEVGKILKLKTGEFRLKYVDEDEDEILLTSDDDLNLCVESMTSPGKTTVRVMVHLISECSNSFVSQTILAT